MKKVRLAGVVDRLLIVTYLKDKIASAPET